MLMTNFNVCLKMLMNNYTGHVNVQFKYVFYNNNYSFTVYANDKSQYLSEDVNE